MNNIFEGLSKSNLRRTGIVFVVWAVLITPFYTGLAADKWQTNTLPSSVEQSLRRVADAMGIVQFEYSVTRSFKNRPATATNSYDARFGGNRFFQRISCKLDNGESAVHEEAYDGELFYFGDPERPAGSRNPAFVTKYMATNKFDPDYYRTDLFGFPYLQMAGLFVPQRIADLNSKFLDSEVLHDVMIGDIQEVKPTGDLLYISIVIPDRVLEGARHLDMDRERSDLEDQHLDRDTIERRLRRLEAMRSAPPKRLVKFTLDPSRQYGTVRREERTLKGDRISLLECSGWKLYTEKNLWLPTVCELQYYTGENTLFEFSDQPLQTVTTELTSVSFSNIAPSGFALDYKQPGTLIDDRTDPEKPVTYEIPAGSITLKNAAKGVMHDLGSNRASKWFWLNIIIVTAIIVIVYIRRHASHRK